MPWRFRAAATLQESEAALQRLGVASKASSAPKVQDVHGQRQEAEVFGMPRQSQRSRRACRDEMLIDEVPGRGFPPAPATVARQKGEEMYKRGMAEGPFELRLGELAQRAARKSNDGALGPRRNLGADTVVSWLNSPRPTDELVDLMRESPRDLVESGKAEKLGGTGASGYSTAGPSNSSRRTQSTWHDERISDWLRETVQISARKPLGRPADLGAERCRPEPGSDAETAAPSSAAATPRSSPSSSRQSSPRSSPREVVPRAIQSARAEPWHFRPAGEKHVSFTASGPEVCVFAQDPAERQLVMPDRVTRAARRRQSSGHWQCSPFQDNDEAEDSPTGTGCEVM